MHHFKTLAFAALGGVLGMAIVYRVDALRKLVTNSTT